MQGVGGGALGEGPWGMGGSKRDVGGVGNTIPYPYGSGSSLEPGPISHRCENLLEATINIWSTRLGSLGEGRGWRGGGRGGADWPPLVPPIITGVSRPPSTRLAVSLGFWRALWPRLASHALYFNRSPPPVMLAIKSVATCACLFNQFLIVKLRFHLSFQKLIKALTFSIFHFSLITRSTDVLLHCLHFTLYLPFHIPYIFLFDSWHPTSERRLKNTKDSELLIKYVLESIIIFIWSRICKFWIR